MNNKHFNYRFPKKIIISTIIVKFCIMILVVCSKILFIFGCQLVKKRQLRTDVRIVRTWAIMLTITCYNWGRVRVFCCELIEEVEFYSSLYLCVCFKLFLLLKMASPRTRRKLNFIRTQDENHVCNFFYLIQVTQYVFLIHIICLIEMFRVWYPKSAMGIGDLRYLDLPGMFRRSSQPWSPLIICAFCYNG